MLTNLFVYGETVIRIRRRVVGRDVYGSDAHATSEEPIRGCAVQRRSELEDVQGRDQVIHGLTLYAPAGTDLDVTDQVRVRGQVYEVEGRPNLWRNPFTAQLAGVEAELVRITG